MGHKVSRAFNDLGHGISGGFKHFGNMTSHFAQNSFNHAVHGFSHFGNFIGHNIAHEAKSFGSNFNHYIIHPVEHTAINGWHSFESLHPLNILKTIANTGLNLAKAIVSIPLKMIMPHPPAKRAPNSIHPSIDESNHLNSDTSQERVMLTYGAIVVGAGVVIYLVM